MQRAWHTTTLLAAGAAGLLLPFSLYAADSGVDALRAEVKQMRQSYESRIDQLEQKISTLEKAKAAPPAVAAPVPSQPAASASAAPAISTGANGGGWYDNSFNPSIGVILNGHYGSYTSENGDFAGFGTGDEGGRRSEGLSLDESELNFAANIDDKFAGSLTASLVSEDGDDSVEIEEAFIQTLPGAGLPNGLTAKAGRAFWTLGYLNEQHPHADDFADRPLPNRVFLGGNYNDDGVQLSYILPTELYTEIGGGAYRGGAYPFGESHGVNAFSAYARVGGDIGDNQDWRIGAYVLSGEGNREMNDGDLRFDGSSDLYIADLRYTWAPSGNRNDQEVILQGEYFWRNENGDYDDLAAGSGTVGFDGHESGWYLQSVYKFLPQWRVGARYSRLDAPYVPVGLSGSVLDSKGHDPQAFAVMGDWTNSEFSRIRLQYNYEDLAKDQDDHQILLQYIMSIGAHAAHVY